MKYNMENSNGMFTWRKGHFNPTICAFKGGLYDGFTYGAILGTMNAVYTRKIMSVPKFGVAFGVAYGSFLGVSQLYRHDI